MFIYRMILQNRRPYPGTKPMCSMWVTQKIPKSQKSVVSIKDQREYIIYQSTYFIEYFTQGNFKYPRIKKIHQVH